jgi:hypothetical protein
MYGMNRKTLLIALSLFAATVFSQAAFAQGLNWEGQTGALITPFAYTAGSPTGKFGKPEVAFHYLNSGNVIGNDYQFSITEGFAKRFEAGFTQAFSSSGSSPLSPLFSNGFSELHGKFTLLPENAFKSKWIPAIAAGAIGRIGNQRVSYYTTGANLRPGSSQDNGDFYIVATKTVTQFKPLPFVLSLGDKVTNASVLGVAGNAGNALNSDQRWQGRLFGAAAFVVKGPAKSALIFGAEALQEPRYVQGLNDYLTGTSDSRVSANIPTSFTYFVRVVPHVAGSRLQVDLGVAQFAGKIAPGVLPTLDARARVGTGISYHF